MNKLSESFDNNVIRNSQLFGEWLEKNGYSYNDVYEILNGNGIDTYNDILQKGGILNDDSVSGYMGPRDYQGSDNGARTVGEKNLDCTVGNIQEELFCLDNPQFRRNPKATGKYTDKDEDITTKSLDLIHIPTRTEIEFKFCYTRDINQKYNTIKYRHRNGHFTEFMRSGKLIIVYFAYLGRVVILDYRNFKDPEKGKYHGYIRLIAKDETDTNGKKWDIVSVHTDICIPYKMLMNGNSEIGNRISEIIKRREVE